MAIKTHLKPIPVSRTETVTTTPEADAIPKADSNGKLDYDWFPFIENMTAMGAYGVRHDEVNDTYLALGGSESPVHDKLKGAVLNESDKSVNYYLKSNDFRRKDSPDTTGTTDDTTTDHLIDSSKNFESDNLAQVGDYVYNATDDTFAKVTAVADGDLTLDADIFVSGEDYELGSNLEGADGPVTIEHAKCYAGVFEKNGYKYYLVADEPVPGLKIHPAFYVGADGDDPREYRYTGKYQAVWVDNGTIKDHDGSTSADTTDDAITSASGFTPITNQTRDDFRKLAANLGNGDFWLEDMQMYDLRRLLYVTHPDVRTSDQPWNSQANVPGYTEEDDWDYSKVEANGLTNSMGIENGTYDDGSKNKANNINGVENMFGSVWELKDAMNINDWLVYECFDPANFADDTTTDYEQKLDQHDAAVVLPDSNDYQQYWWPGTMLPMALGASSDTHFCDYFYQNSGWRVLRVGGSLDHGSKAGVSYLFVNYGSSDVNSDIGARLSA